MSQISIIKKSDIQEACRFDDLDDFSFEKCGRDNGLSFWR